MISLLEMTKIFLTNLLMPIIFLVWLGAGTYSSIIEWLLFTFGIGTYMIYIFISGFWFYYGFYLRYLMVFIMVILIINSFISSIGLALFEKIGLKGWIGLLFFVIFSILTMIALKGYRYTDENAINVSFPLRNGSYYIANGGSTFVINDHCPALTSKFALDIVKINRLGFRAKGFYPKDLGKYFIFGETVYSPLEGIIVKAVDDLPDLIPPNRDEKHPGGNYVVIRNNARNVQILLVHLQKNSLLVKEGDFVAENQQIGKAGNSGNTDEPHLHIHGTTIANGDFIISGKGVPFIFNGRFLRRNSVVRSYIN